jgi:glucokinase
VQGDARPARGDGLTVDTVLAVDIGGTKIAAGIVDASGSLLRSATAPTPRDPDPEAVFAALTSAVARVDPAGVRALGVGTAGPMSAGGVTVSPLNIPGWNGFPLLERLQREYALPTVVDGRLLHGADGNAGHIGHVIVVPEGAICRCGGHGCLEAEISGTAIAKRLGAPASEAGTEEIERAGRLLGLGVASVVNLLDLSAVLVGGSVALGFGEPFFAAANAALRSWSRLDYAAGCEIRPIGLVAEGPLVGAAGLAWRMLGQDIGVR